MQSTSPLPYDSMPMEITLLRHGETEANLADVWQGHTDSPLSDRGRRQAEAVAKRLAGRAFDVVVSSDLGRAEATAASLGRSYQSDSAWRELDMGEWESLHRDEVFARFTDQLSELHSGKDIKWGGAESYGDFVRRVDAALDRLAGEMQPGRRALVVTHGGVLHAVVAGLMGFRDRRRPWPVGRMHNGSLTTFHIGDDGRRRLAVFNDVSHLDGDVEGQPTEGPEVNLIRHGESVGNVEGRWQGSTNGALTRVGRRQARQLAEWQRDLTAVWSSPLERARGTAAAIAEGAGIPHFEQADFAEMDLGDWENLTTEEIKEGWPREWRRIYTEGADMPRGGSGETFAGVAERMERGLRAVADGSGLVGVVSHAGAIRAFLSGILGLEFLERERLGYPLNTGSSRVMFAEWGPVLVDYNVAPHLDR